MNFASFSDEFVRHSPRRSGGLIVIEQVDSTHLLGRRIVEEYAREASLAPTADIVSWCQATGRGRQGRSWSSPPGAGVYATLLRESGDTERLQILPLRVAVALCQRLNEYLGGLCRLKWPNDLLVGERKLGGVLIDVVTHGDETRMVTLSFGVNYSRQVPAVSEAQPTSLLHELSMAAKESVEPPTLAGLALALIEAVDLELAREDSAAEVVTRYEALSSHAPGDVLRCRIGDGKPLEGVFRGFDGHGFLRLEVAGKERLLPSAEVLSDEVSGGD